MKCNHGKIWAFSYLVIVICALALISWHVIKVDPFMHYHAPDTEHYYYTLDNQRSQNDGIIRHFTYDALITGTSMTENFKTSDLDAFFGTHSIKVPYSGGSYKEINESISKAIACNPDLRIVVRGLDLGKIIEDKDAMREDLGEFPTYLYDQNPFNDVRYLFNRDIVFNRVYMMEKDASGGKAAPGITFFDDYSNWMNGNKFGLKSLTDEKIANPEPVPEVYLTEEDRNTALANIRQNVVALAQANPDISFYYYITPYSILWWRTRLAHGTLDRFVEAEKLLIQECLRCPNIKLYSFNNEHDIISDLNHYKDPTHYGAWINSLILQYMAQGRDLVTRDNYQTLLEEELTYFKNFDYTQLNAQADYDNDYYAAALLNEEIYGTSPLDLLNTDCQISYEIQNASLVPDQYERDKGLICTGTLSRESRSSKKVGEYIAENDEYCGMKIHLDDISKYHYLVFYGRKNQNHGQPLMYIYDKDMNLQVDFSLGYKKIDREWHQYLIDVTDLTGPVTIIMHGGYIDQTGSESSSYTFSKVILY